MKKGITVLATFFVLPAEEAAWACQPGHPINRHEHVTADRTKV